MATLNASRWGYIQGPEDASFSTARTAATGDSVVTNPSSVAVAVQHRYMGRGTPKHSFIRSFFYFDTTNVTGAPTSATLDLEGTTTVLDTTVVQVVRSTAFSGDGSTDLVVADFNNTAFLGDGYEMSGIYNTWTKTGTNSISLNSTAMNFMQTSNYLILCLMQYGNDYRGALPASTQLDNAGIDLSTTPLITHNGTVASTGPSSIEAFNTRPVNKLEKLNGIAYSSIEAINGIS